MKSKAIVRALALTIFQAGVGRVLPSPLVILAGFSGVIVGAVIAMGWVACVIEELLKPSLCGLPVPRVMNVVATVIGVMPVICGILALEAAERSARVGGGLLGAFGFMPVSLGVSLAVSSIIAICLLWPGKAAREREFLARSPKQRGTSARSAACQDGPGALQYAWWRRRQESLGNRK